MKIHNKFIVLFLTLVATAMPTLFTAGLSVAGGGAASSTPLQQTEETTLNKQEEINAFYNVANAKLNNTDNEANITNLINPHTNNQNEFPKAGSGALAAPQQTTTTLSHPSTLIDPDEPKNTKEKTKTPKPTDYPRLFGVVAGIGLSALLIELYNTKPNDVSFVDHVKAKFMALTEEQAFNRENKTFTTLCILLALAEATIAAKAWSE